MILKVISAEDVLFEGNVSVVHLPGALGAFTVLPGHASLISTLVPGDVVFRLDYGEERSVSLSGGIVDVDSNIVSVCIY